MSEGEAKRCGRPTKVCQACQHHLRCHQKELCRQFKGPQDPCDKATGEPCHTFAARPCMSTSVMHNGACMLHGGKALRGIAAPAYKGKDYGKYLPKRLLTDWEELQHDDERLSLRREIDMLRLQLGEVLRQMYDETQAFAFDALVGAIDANRAAYRKVQVAQRAGSAEKMAEALTEWGQSLAAMTAALDPAVAQDEGRRKTSSIALALDRLLRTENTVRLAERGMVTLEAVMARDRAMMDAWKEALDAKVGNVETREAIRRDIARLYTEFVGRREAPALIAAGTIDVIDAEPAASTDG